MKMSTKASNKPNLAVFTAFYPPHMGGVERFTSSLASAIEAQGHYHVVVVTNNLPDAQPHEFQDDGVEVFRLPCRGLLGGRFPQPKTDAKYRALWAALEQREYAGVFINTRFYPHSLKGLELAEHAGVRAVVLDHGSAHLTMGMPVLDQAVRHYEHAMTKKGMAHKPVYYGVSQASAAWLGHFGIQAAGVINNSIDAASYRASASSRDYRSELGVPEGALLVAFSGRLVAAKGADVFAQAARGFSAEQATFVIAGDGQQRAQIERMKLPNVHLLGMLDPADVAALMLQADVLCFPSTYPEGLPTVFLEAGACDTAIVTTHVGGADEVIPNASYGIVLESADAIDFAGAVQWYLENPNMLAAHKRALREHIEQDFSWETTAARVVAAIEKANP